MAVGQILSAAVVTLILTSWPCDAWKKDVKVRYYGTAILRCRENETHIPNAQVFWITPDASVIEETTPESQLPKNVIRVNGTVISMLNVTKVDDDQFGYYTCVMISESSRAVTLARWGLNVDGADFSDLEKQYRESAVIGAIAAAVMLVVLGGGCLIWHFRYSRRDQNSSGPASGIEDGPKKTSEQLYHNRRAFDNPTADVEAADDMGNGSAASTAEAATAAGSDQENVGYESFKM